MQAVIQNVKKNDEGEILMNKIMDAKKMPPRQRQHQKVKIFIIT